MGKKKIIITIALRVIKRGTCCDGEGNEKEYVRVLVYRLEAPFNFVFVYMCVYVYKG